jgi:hypothetical protein
MTPYAYKTERTKRGTQKSVAIALGVHVVTVAKRETGKAKITHEAWLALLQIPENPPYQHSRSPIKMPLASI